MEPAGRWGEAQWSADPLGEQDGDPRAEAEDGVNHGVGGCREEAQAPGCPSAGLHSPERGKEAQALPTSRGELQAWARGQKSS